MEEFFFHFRKELLFTFLIALVLILARFALNKTADRVGKRQNMNVARIRLMFRYINLFIVFVAVFALLFSWGYDWRKLAVLFSSIFAVIGIGLFAIWSILSNITSGIIMFFNFPYKIGDRIKIHDKDFPLDAIIEDIRAFHLHLRTHEGELVTYPNNLMLQKAVSLVEKDAVMEEGKEAL
ncbi:MAG TPA: mechanosensitive ion channel domain-containing protein [Flavobacteriaceae bacterium]|nr:mechanosensitive ion channel domain-containing protein [Flavobacteriaceae bacterium]